MLKQFIKQGLSIFGFDPIRMFNLFRGFPYYLSDYFTLRKELSKNSDFNFGLPCPILHEKFSESGTMSGHYFHQDLVVAKKIYQNKPAKHVDVGSRLDGFVAHVASYRGIEVFDIRRQNNTVENIHFTQVDLMHLPENLINYCDSISSLHAIEHFGLGRYGDNVDSDGHLKGLDNIFKVLKEGGKFYFSVPIGKQRINFNAHRVFDLKYLLNLFRNKYRIDSFSYVNDQGNFFENASLNETEVDSNFGCWYGCGIFEMTKMMG